MGEPEPGSFGALVGVVIVVVVMLALHLAVLMFLPLIGLGM